MTCIIGYIDRKNKKTYIGADNQVSVGLSKFNLPKNDKIFKPKDTNIIVADSGDVRASQIIRNFVHFPTDIELQANNEEFNEKYIVTKLIPNIQNALKNNEWKDKGERSNTWMLIAYKDKLWKIYSNYGILEVQDDFDSFGCGEQLALGSLYALKYNEELSIEEKIHKSLQCSAYYSDGIDKPYYIMNTEDYEIKEYLE